MAIEQSPYEIDSFFIKNQPVAKHGALQYPKGGGLKQKEDLERNAGRTVVILAGHPSKNNGKDGLHNGEREYGKAHLKMCPLDPNKLCADLELDDDAPDMDGYSIGFSFDQLLKNGEVGGVKYNHVQSNLWVNHVALTDFPRDGEALQIPPYVLGDEAAATVKMKKDDSRAAEDGKLDGQDGTADSLIIIRMFATDSFRFTNPRVEEIKAELRKDPRNGEVSEDAIHSRAVKMYVNESKLKRKHKIKVNTNQGKNNHDSETNMVEKEVKEEEKVEQTVTQSDDDKSELERLRLENAKLKSDKAADEKYADALKAKEDRIKKLEADNLEKDKKIRKNRESGLDARYDAIEADVGLKASDKDDFKAILTEFEGSIDDVIGIDSSDLRRLALDTLEWSLSIIARDDPPQGTELDEKQQAELDAQRGRRELPAQDPGTSAHDGDGAAIGKRWFLEKAGYGDDVKYDPRAEARAYMERRGKR